VFLETPLYVIILYCLQPTRLNVVKNDSDTWDYTNPNLGNMVFCLLISLKMLHIYSQFFSMQCIHIVYGHSFIIWTHTSDVIVFGLPYFTFRVFYARYLVAFIMDVCKQRLCILITTIKSIIVMLNWQIVVYIVKTCAWCMLQFVGDTDVE